MWLLDSDGKSLGGNRLWLRPGSRFVLGRIKGSGVTVDVPQEKSVSRTHLVINVGEVNDEDGIKIHARSSIVFQDNKTKHGTKVNGEQIRGENKTVIGDVHTFSLGKCDEVFRVSWVPVILSFSLTGRERKNKAAMIPHRNKVEAFDIKTIGTWTSETTHVVASKRNTAIGLQGLVNGRPIVTSDYLDAIEKVARQPTESGERSPLEVNFDENFPSPDDFLPPHQNEPVDRPVGLYRPDERRRKLFDGWVFIFCDDTQYSNLLGPITDAHGKAEKFTLQYPNTIAPDIVDFVKKRGQSGEVVPVRFTYKKDMDWSDNLVTECEKLLGYQMVAQNAFLDIILTCNTDDLRKPLEEDPAPTPSGATAMQKPPNPSARIQKPPTPVEQAPPPESTKMEYTQVAPRVGRGRRRPIPASTGFDFDLGGDFLPAPTPVPDDVDMSMPASSIPDSYMPEMTSTVLDPTQMSMDFPFTQTQHPPSAQPATQRSQRKRPPPPPTPPPVQDTKDAELDVMDLLPGAKVVKRRKIAEAREQASHPSPQPPSPPREATPPPPTTPAKPAKTTKKDKPVNPFVEKSRAYRAEQDSIKDEPIDTSGINSLKNLAIVETMSVLRPRRAAERSVHGEDGDRWKPEWNGRKNFKGFRRREGSAVRSMAASRTMVGLVEVRRGDYGIGDGYWVGDVREGSGSREETRESSVRRGKAQEVEISDDEPDSIKIPGLPRTQAQGRAGTQRSEVAVRETQSPLKRPAERPPGRSVSKRMKPMRIPSEDEEDSDDDDDGLKFRLR